jgi:hypothetical protein
MKEDIYDRRACEVRWQAFLNQLCQWSRNESMIQVLCVSHSLRGKANEDQQQPQLDLNVTLSVIIDWQRKGYVSN